MSCREMTIQLFSLFVLINDTCFSGYITTDTITNTNLDLKRLLVKM
jgi:hypothetical protein